MGLIKYFKDIYKKRQDEDRARQTDILKKTLESNPALAERLLDLAQAFNYEPREEYVSLVAPDYRNEFVNLFRTGKASQNFFDYIDRDSQASKALDLCFEESYAKIDRAVKKFHKDSS